MELTGADRWERRAVAAVVLAAAFLRLFRIGRQSFWVDEFLSLNAARSPEGVPYARKLLYDVHGPLHSLFMHFWIRVSESEWWLRLPSAAAGVLAVYLLYRWLAGSGRRGAALPAALLMALSPFHLYYSQELRFYAFLSLFAVITLIAFDRFLRSPSPKSGVLLGVAVGLACLSHFSGLFLGAGLVVYMLLARRLRGGHLRYGMLGFLVACAIVSPWVYREVAFLRTIRVFDVSTLPVAERYRGELTLSAWSYPYIPWAFAAGYSFGPGLRELHGIGSGARLFAAYRWEIIAVAAVFGGLVVSGCVRSARRGDLVFFGTVLVTAIVSLSIVARFNMKVFNVRYLMSVFPIFIALLAYGLPARGPARLAALCAASAVMLVSDGNYFFAERYARDDIRGAAAVVSREERPGDLLLVPTVWYVYSHYYRGPNTIESASPAVLGRDGFETWLDAGLATPRRVWYVSCRPWDGDPAGVIPRALGERCDLKRTWELAGVRLHLYECPAR